MYMLAVPLVTARGVCLCNVFALHMWELEFGYARNC